MMEGMHAWMILKSVEYCLIVCLFLLVQSTCAQKGFQSIACCAESDFTDNLTSISWTSDNGWFSGDTSCSNISKAAANYRGNDTVRVFHINSGTRCYNLQIIPHQDYLIRGTFLFDDSATSLSPSFEVSIVETPISLVNLIEDSEVESIFRATNENTSFCLAHYKGDPYISKLELRPLDDSKYLQGNASKVLKLVSRINTGNTGDGIRYPDDQYDRIWTNANSTKVSISQAQVTSSSNSVKNASSTVPLKVLQTAVTHTDRLEFLHNNLDAEEYSYTVFLYFLELDYKVTPNQRVFDIYINNVRQKEGFDIMANGSNYKEIAPSVTAKGSLNLTLVKVSNKSDFGPLLNAYEIHQVLPQLQGTNQKDVDAIANVRDALLLYNMHNELLQRWTEDPCLPLSWKGLTCHNSNGFSFITRLSISSSQLQGPIPSSITNLTYLKELNLSYNYFTGSIPEFPASSVLTSVDLSHNNLSGFLPQSLASLPELTTLYFGCNPRLSEGFPSGFNSSGLTTDSGECFGQESVRKLHGIVVGTVAGGSVLFTLALGIFCAYCNRQRLMARGKFDRKQLQMMKNAVFSLPSTDDVALKSISIQTFSLQSIENATQKYKTLIGEGGFGSVYRGTLPDGQQVAVKVRSSTSSQGTREFENELNLLSAIRHDNLVPLLGYCCESDQQILVYPFMSNGSLQDRLFGEAAKRKTLDWPTRLSIALGAARGLMYLHTFAGRCVIHRDVKSSNILLDQSMNAKVADFGFSKYAPQEGDSGASLEVRGTAGYLDPEYYSTQHLSAKSDVFSFGVVLLEIVSGREPLNVQRPRNEWSLVEWAKPYIRESRIDEIVDPSIKGGYHSEAMWRVVEVALACIEPFSAYRPCMADIVRELEDALIIENNASEYMKSIDSLYSLGGSNHFSMVMDKRITLPPPTPTPTELSPIPTQPLAPPHPR